MTQAKRAEKKMWGLPRACVKCRLETLSIDDGNGNGDGETEERLRRGRGCLAKLEAVKQAQYDDNVPRRALKKMSAFHSPKIFDLNFRKSRSRMERAYSRSVSTFREQL